MNYCLGFAFRGDVVYLIRKERPAFMAGKLNGIGGKLEPGEDPLEAMRREFKEEAGLTVSNWHPFYIIPGNGYTIHCFAVRLRPAGPVPGADLRRHENRLIEFPGDAGSQCLRAGGWHGDPGEPR